jgi:hypothetical protein
MDKDELQHLRNAVRGLLSTPQLLNALLSYFANEADFNGNLFL